MKVRGSVEIKKRLKLTNPGGLDPSDGLYAISDATGNVNWGHLSIPKLDLGGTYQKAGVLVNHLGKVLFSLVTGADGNRYDDPSVWLDITKSTGDQLTDEQLEAVNNATSPSAGNPFATMREVHNLSVKGTDIISNILTKSPEEVNKLWIASNSGEDSQGNIILAGDGIISTGVSWVGIGPFRGPAGGIDSPIDGKYYVRQNTAWTELDISIKADKNNAVLTGTPQAPTATVGTNTDQLATTKFVNASKQDLQSVTAIGAITTTPIIVNTLDLEQGDGGSIMGISDIGAGLFGSSTNGNGVYGFSNNLNGVTGQSINSTGVKGFSNYGIGVEAHSDTGVTFLAKMPSSNTSDIAQFQKNGVNQVVIQNDGKITATAGVVTTDVVVKSQLDLKADIASPTFTGAPQAPTAAAGTNSNQIATTAYVLANSDPTALHKTGAESFTGVKSAVNNSNGNDNGIKLTQEGGSATVLDITNISSSSSSSGIKGTQSGAGDLLFVYQTAGTAINIYNSTSAGSGIYLNINGSNSIGLQVNTTGSNGANKKHIDLIDNSSNAFLGVMLNISHGTTTNSNSTPIRFSAEGATLFQVSNTGETMANSFKKIGGTSAQFLKADGSVDTTVYMSSNKQRVVIDSFSISDADNGYVIVIDNVTTPITITVPSGLMNKIEVGFIQLGTGDVTFIESGTVIKFPSTLGLKIKGQNYNSFLMQIAASNGTATNNYNLLGDIKA